MEFLFRIIRIVSKKEREPVPLELGRGKRSRALTGFTMLELVLVAGITGIIAVVVLVNLGQGERNLAVRRSAQKIVAALREAQNMTLGGSEVGSPAQMPEGGFGVYFQVGQSPSLFADFNESHTYQTSQTPLEEQRTILLDAGVTVSAVSPQTLECCLHVVFFPPNPDVYMNGALATSDALIIVQFGSSTRSVRVNQLGNISIE